MKKLEKKRQSNKERKAWEKTLYQKISKGWRVFKGLKRKLKQIKRYRYNIVDNIDYKGIREIEHLFNEINEEDYYEPIKSNHAFDDDYIEYESRRDKDNNLLLAEYLIIIWPYLRDMIDNHKLKVNGKFS